MSQSIPLPAQPGILSGITHIKDSFTLYKRKTGGATDAGKEGGVYKFTRDVEEVKKGTFILFKQGHNDGETISEYVSSELYNLLIPGQAARCVLLPYEPSEERAHKDGKTEGIYVGSIFYDEYKSGTDLMSLKERSWFANYRHHDKVKTLVETMKPEGLAEVMAAAAFLGDFDIHSDNIGLAKKSPEEIGQSPTSKGPEATQNKKAVKIDHGWSLYHLTDKIHLFDTRHHMTPGKPTNHFWDFSVNKRNVYVSEAFADTMLKMADTPIDQIKDCLTHTLNHANTLYPIEGMRSFAKHIGMPDQATKAFEKSNVVEHITEFLAEKIEARQKSAKDLASQIKMELCFHKEKSSGKMNIGMTESGIRKSTWKHIEANPEYFAQSRFHFRHPDCKKQEKRCTEIIQNEVEKYLIGKLHQSDIKGLPDQIPPKSTALHELFKGQWSRGQDGQIEPEQKKRVIEIIKPFLTPERIHKRDHKGNTILDHAAKLGDPDLVNLLLDKGAQVRGQTIDNWIDVRRQDCNVLGTSGYAITDRLATVYEAQHPSLVDQIKTFVEQALRKVSNIPSEIIKALRGTKLETSQETHGHAKAGEHTLKEARATFQKEEITPAKGKFTTTSVIGEHRTKSIDQKNRS